MIVDTNITLGVKDTRGIEFSTTVIAYPEPQYKVTYVNGTKNDRMMVRLTCNAENNFTIHLNQTIVYSEDYGTYLLQISNPYGRTTVFLSVIPQSK